MSKLQIHQTYVLIPDLCPLSYFYTSSRSIFHQIIFLMELSLLVLRSSENIETELTLQRVDTDQTKGVIVQLLVSPRTYEAQFKLNSVECSIY